MNKNTSTHRKTNGDGVTIREVYDLLAAMDGRHKADRDELMKSIKELKDDIEKTQTDINARIEKHEEEIYGKGETRGIKARVGLAENSIKGHSESMRWERYKNLLTTLVASITAAIVGGMSHK